VTRVANTFPCCEHLFPCCEHLFHIAKHVATNIQLGAPSLLPRHSVHVASDVASLWRACGDQYANIVLRTVFPCCKHLFTCCEHFFHVAPPPSSPDKVYMLRAMLRACGEHVATNIQTSACWRSYCELCCPRPTRVSISGY
jgi:hypothetical protein